MQGSVVISMKLYRSAQTKSISKSVTIRHVANLRHQVWQRVFWEGPKFFKLYPIVLNYVQHTFPGEAKKTLGSPQLRPGGNVVVDTVTRAEIEVIFHHAAQNDWNDFAKLIETTLRWNDTYMKTTLLLSLHMSGTVWKYFCDVSRAGVPRPLVPCGFRHIISGNCRNLTHSAFRATIKFISETYTWQCRSNLVWHGSKQRWGRTGRQVKNVHSRVSFSRKSTLTRLDPCLYQNAIVAFWCALISLHAGLQQVLCPETTFKLSFLHFCVAESLKLGPYSKSQWAKNLLSNIW